MEPPAKKKRKVVVMTASYDTIDSTILVKNPHWTFNWLHDCRTQKVSDPEITITDVGEVWFDSRGKVDFSSFPRLDFLCLNQTYERRLEKPNGGTWSLPDLTLLYNVTMDLVGHYRRWGQERSFVIDWSHKGWLKEM